jgi:hypothetical protein
MFKKEAEPDTGKTSSAMAQNRGYAASTQIFLRAGQKRSTAAYSSR